jgi:hypothetical protein
LAEHDQTQYKPLQTQYKPLQTQYKPLPDQMSFLEDFEGDPELLTDDYGRIVTALYGTEGLTMDEIQISIYDNEQEKCLLIPINRINSLLSDLVFKKVVAHRQVRNKATRRKETKYFLIQKEGE